MKKILLTLALRKRQTLRKRIDTVLENLTLVGAVVGNDARPHDRSYKTKEEYAAEMRAGNDSFLALQAEYYELVSEINKANNTHTIVVNGKEVTLATAIEMRNTINWSRDYVAKLGKQYSVMTSRVDKSNEALDGEIQNVLVRTKSESMTVEDIAQLELQTRERLEKANKAFLFDPLGATKLYEVHSANFSELVDELDTKLNIANATITIGSDE